MTKFSRKILHNNSSINSANPGKNDFANVKIALVCDWLTEVGGAENVLRAVHEMFPRAPIFTSQFRKKSAPKYFANADIRTGWLNIFPRYFRKFISPLRYFYFAHLNLRDYDLIISINNAEAKNISRKNLKKSALHVSYLQGPPTQYYWGLYDKYIANPGFGKLNFLARFGLKLLVKLLRKIDFAAAQRPDVLLANSTYVKSEIREFYQRDSIVLHPNVDVENIAKLAAKIREKDCQNLCQKLFNGEKFFLVAGRQVAWKRQDLAIKACAKIGANLLLVSGGAEHEKLVKLAAQNPHIKFLPHYDGVREIVQYFAAARAFIFPSLEPFGITPVEALAAGCPVAAFAKGGALDFIRDGENGVFFAGQNVDDVVRALRKINEVKFDKKLIQRSAETFSEANFQQNFHEILTNILAKKHDK